MYMYIYIIAYDRHLFRLFSIETLPTKRWVYEIIEIFVIIQLLISRNIRCSVYEEQDYCNWR